jgi:hypothetical protein
MGLKIRGLGINVSESCVRSIYNSCLMPLAQGSNKGCAIYFSTSEYCHSMLDWLIMIQICDLLVPAT